MQFFNLNSVIKFTIWLFIIGLDSLDVNIIFGFKRQFFVISPLECILMFNILFGDKMYN